MSKMIAQTVATMGRVTKKFAQITLGFMLVMGFLITLGAIASHSSMFMMQLFADDSVDATGAIVLFDELEYGDESTRCSYIPGFLYFKNTDKELITDLEFYPFDGTTAALSRVEIIYPRSLPWRHQHGRVFLESVKPQQEVFVKLEVEYCIVGPSEKFKVIANQAIRTRTPSREKVFMTLNQTGRGGFAGSVPSDYESSFFDSMVRTIDWSRNIEDKAVWIGATSAGYPDQTFLTTHFEKARVFPLASE